MFFSKCCKTDLTTDANEDSSSQLIRKNSCPFVFFCLFTSHHNHILLNVSNNIDKDLRFLQQLNYFCFISKFIVKATNYK